MNILKYAAGLLPMFPRNRLEEDARVTRTAIETTALTAYKRAEEVFSGKLKSPEGQKFAKEWKSLIQNPGREQELVPSIRRKLEECLPALDYADKAIASDFEVDVVVAGITIKKATIVRILELEAFIATYSLRFLNYLYVCETAAVGAKNAIQDQLSPGEIKLITHHFTEFCMALNAIARSEKDLVKQLDAVPDVLVDARGSAALASLSGNKVDPLSVFGIKNFTYNPIYHIGQIVAEMQASSYKRNVELLAVLELRAMNLQQQQSNNPDAGVEREITVVQGRIDKLSETIRKQEESIQ